MTNKLSKADEEWIAGLSDQYGFLVNDGGSDGGVALEAVAISDLRAYLALARQLSAAQVPVSQQQLDDLLESAFEDAAIDHITRSMVVLPAQPQEQSK